MAELVRYGKEHRTLVPAQHYLGFCENKLELLSGDLASSYGVVDSKCPTFGELAKATSALAVIEDGLTKHYTELSLHIELVTALGSNSAPAATMLKSLEEMRAEVVNLRDQVCAVHEKACNKVDPPASSYNAASEWEQVEGRPGSKTARLSLSSGGDVTAALSRAPAAGRVPAPSDGARKAPGDAPMAAGGGAEAAGEVFSAARSKLVADQEKKRALDEKNKATWAELEAAMTTAAAANAAPATGAAGGGPGPSLRENARARHRRRVGLQAVNRITRYFQAVDAKTARECQKRAADEPSDDSGDAQSPLPRKRPTMQVCGDRLRHVM